MLCLALLHSRGCRLNRRWFLTCSTAASLCSAYALYARLVSPFLAPRVETIARQQKVVPDSQIDRPVENVKQAQEHLHRHSWAADAKYQVRTDEMFVYAEEWNPIENTGKVRFRPFAMIWRPKNHPPEKAPITIVAESALVEFAGKFDVTNPKPGRVVGGALEGDVAVRGADNLSLDGKNFNFSEGALRIWSDNPVAFTYGPHKGRGLGVELDLIPEPGPPGNEKPAVSGVRTVRLRKDVAMELVSESKDGRRPPENVFVNSAGSFEFNIETHVAAFHKTVRVSRPTGNNQFDKLNCETLTLVFEPEKKSGPSEQNPDAKQTPPVEDKSFTGSLGGNLAFRRLRAEGPLTTVISQRADMNARMTELTYDEEAKVVVLRDARQVRLVQKNNELFSPEVTAVLDKDGQIERAVCRGAGKLFSYQKEGKGTVPRPGKRKVEFAAEWLKQLRKEPDPQAGLDLIELEGQAVVSQAGKMALQADIVRLWVTPGRPEKVSAASTGKSRDDDVHPKRMLALQKVAFTSPQIDGETDRLEVWFEEGTLPQPPIARHEPRAAKHSVLRPPSSKSNAPAVIKPASKTSESSPAEPSQTPPSEKPEKIPENPLHVESDVIRVRAMMDGDKTEVAEVVTEGKVHVTQDHKPGEQPLDLTGDRLHLWNYSESNQVLRVEGKPAQIRDRGMQLEGGDIHFDRGQNVARVDGAGVLRLPVKNGLDGKLLAKPQLLDIFWKEKMEFDGQVAKFFDDVRTALEGNEMRCEEMHVTLMNRISFAESSSDSEKNDVRLIICRDGVEIKSREYEANRLTGVRLARGFEFAFDQATGKVTAVGPGTLKFWRRGNGKRAALGPASGVNANRPLQAESSDWEYTRIDFSGKMKGNTNERSTAFKDRVKVVYGPVDQVTDVVDEDNLPKDGGWMKCDELQLTQHEKTRTQPAYIDILAAGNAELEGRSFHALADNVSYDESKGLYIISATGRRDAKIWREETIGAKRSLVAAPRMEFNPSLNQLKIDRASEFQGLQ